MSESAKILVRNARDQDLPAVAEIDSETSSLYDSAEKLVTFEHQLTAFPNGFIILVADNEIAAYACSEKWLTERRPRVGENPLLTHQPDGRIFWISHMAVKNRYRGQGYQARILDKMLEIAHQEGCRKIILQTSQDRDLYLARGFQTVQQRDPQGLNKEVMALEIVSYGSKA